MEGSTLDLPRTLVHGHIGHYLRELYMQACYECLTFVQHLNEIMAIYVIF